MPVGTLPSRAAHHCRTHWGDSEVFVISAARHREDELDYPRHPLLLCAVEEANSDGHVRPLDRNSGAVVGFCGANDVFDRRARYP